MAKGSYNIRKTQDRSDLFNVFSDEYNKGKSEREKEYVESKLFDEAFRLATKFIRYRRRKLKRLKHQQNELENY